VGGVMDEKAQRETEDGDLVHETEAWWNLVTWLNWKIGAEYGVLLYNPSWAWIRRREAQARLDAFQTVKEHLLTNRGDGTKWRENDHHQ